MKSRLVLRLLVVMHILAAAIIGAPASAFAQEASPSPASAEGIEITGEVANPGVVTAADARALPAETVDVTYRMDDGTEATHTYTGARFWDVLQLAQPRIDPEAPQSSLQMFAVLTASDGYIVVISLGEIDPEFGDHPYLLAWEEDGQPLPGERGPLMLVPQGDRSEGRYIWSIVSIDIRTVSPESGE